MKCPKCGYLGFEEADRCRNCGYDFALASPAPTPELPIRASRDDQPDADPLNDLALLEAAAAPKRPAPPASPDLPLFSLAARDDAPLITRVSPPRPPLAVRRATPEVPRLRGEAPRLPTTPMLDLDLPADESPSRGRYAAVARGEAHDTWRGDPARGTAENASAFARIAATIVDLTILAAVDVAVVYLTMKICGLSLNDLAVVPKIPLIAFLVLQNGGYLVAFTAGGQTLGKMVAGIKVVSTRPEGAIGVGDSIVRTLVWAALTIPAGLGFATALLSSDRRGLHDRCAGTRVVRASA